MGSPQLPTTATVLPPPHSRAMRGPEAPSPLPAPWPAAAAGRRSPSGGTHTPRARKWPAPGETASRGPNPSAGSPNSGRARWRPRRRRPCRDPHYGFSVAKSPRPVCPGDPQVMCCTHEGRAALRRPICRKAQTPTASAHSVGPFAWPGSIRRSRAVPVSLRGHALAWARRQRRAGASHLSATGAEPAPRGSVRPPRNSTPATGTETYTA